MASRYAGRRVATFGATRRKKVAKRGKVRRAGHRKDEPLRPKERWQLIQLAVCGGVFVLLVAATLLLPGRMERVNEKLAGAITRNMDVQAVFSAVGGMISGEHGVDAAADEVYQAVFQPAETESALKTSVIVPGDGKTTALDVLRDYRKGDAWESPEEEPPETAAAEVSTLAYVLYSEENLPQNVSMEQTILGFDYCVPVNGTLSSDFGYRDHPMQGEERFHYGVDLAADTGTEIRCFADGTVTAVGESSSYGKYCMVAHESGYTTLYAHCHRITVSSGTKVQEGQKIAEVGETGITTGPHLHFELQHDGTYLNPIYYVTAI